MAYSLVSSDEVAYMLDLHLFLGQGLRLHSTSGSTTTNEDEQWPSGTIYRVNKTLVRTTFSLFTIIVSLIPRPSLTAFQGFAKAGREGLRVRLTVIVLLILLRCVW